MEQEKLFFVHPLASVFSSDSKRLAVLFQTFQGEERSVTAAGLPCADRLEALQRIVEHEMVHLLELLVWRESSCNRERFQRLAGSLFAHSGVRHELVTS